MLVCTFDLTFEVAGVFGVLGVGGMGFCYLVGGLVFALGYLVFWCVFLLSLLFWFGLACGLGFVQFPVVCWCFERSAFGWVWGLDVRV